LLLYKLKTGVRPELLLPNSVAEGARSRFFSIVQTWTGATTVQTPGRGAERGGTVERGDFVTHVCEIIWSILGQDLLKTRGTKSPLFVTKSPQFTVRGNNIGA